jgi:hypothetical protein
MKKMRGSLHLSSRLPRNPSGEVHWSPQAARCSGNIREERVHDDAAASHLGFAGEGRDSK